MSGLGHAATALVDESRQADTDAVLTAGGLVAVDISAGIGGHAPAARAGDEAVVADAAAGRIAARVLAAAAGAGVGWLGVGRGRACAVAPG